MSSNPNTQPKFSKYELNEEQLEKATGGYTRQKPDGTAAGNVAANGASLKVLRRDGHERTAM
jgi:hypothetical protein